MPRPWSVAILVVLALLSLAACYGLRYGLMESDEWVGICADTPAVFACSLRSALGWLIHLRVIAWAAIVFAGLGFVLPGRFGWAVAVLGLLLGLAGLVLYSASISVFAVVLAVLRLVRAPHSSLTAAHNS
ncbi:hypothetical protein [Pseudomonas sp. M30-35]|uniref:hypothetical protein n=1 Tax=Pseudomonas sp. M30-35 TaxID=1981174 RepID=UPI000B3C41CD|nr:hypothetical protein [Pseudomonas sp. M30-35]ARU89133.1 hypothetical protein B9K09_14685 [Pseudomonas sp. M30-35]